MTQMALAVIYLFLKPTLAKRVFGSMPEAVQPNFNPDARSRSLSIVDRTDYNPTVYEVTTLLLVIAVPCPTPTTGPPLSAECSVTPPDLIFLLLSVSGSSTCLAYACAGHVMPCITLRPRGPDLHLVPGLRH